jgi:ABC-type glycerol-3-phosphate transport system substrate-binding protein
MKRYLLVFVMASLLLSSCGAAKPATESPVEITFTMWGAPEELAVWQAVVDDFHKASPTRPARTSPSRWMSRIGIRIGQS